MQSIPEQRKNIIFAEAGKLITGFYGTGKHGARTQIEGSEKLGGYGIPRTLSHPERRAKALALLEDWNFLYEGGVSALLGVPIYVVHRCFSRLATLETL